MCSDESVDENASTSANNEIVTISTSDESSNEKTGASSENDRKIATPSKYQ